MSLILFSLGIDLSAYEGSTKSASYASGTDAQQTSSKEAFASIDTEEAEKLADKNAELMASDVSGQADIVFAIDTTGSMSGTISNVVTNVVAFANALSENYNVATNYALIAFKDNEDGLLHGNCSMFRRSVNVSIKLGIVGFILLENVVDGSQQHPCNGNDSFFVTSALF